MQFQIMLSYNQVDSLACPEDHTDREGWNLDLVNVAFDELSGMSVGV
jgi:hypothetical protein